MAIDFPRLGRGLLFATVYALSLAFILSQAPVYATLPQDVPLPYVHLFPLGPIAALYFVLMLFLAIIAVLPRRPEVGAFMIPVTLTLLLAGFHYSNIDWSRVLVDLHLTQGGIPPAQQVVLTWVPLALLGLYFENEEAIRLRRHYVAKGIDAGEAAEAARFVRASSLMWLFPALLTTLAVFFAYSFSRDGGLQEAVRNLPIGLLFTPVFIALAVAVLAYVFSRRK